MDSGIAVLISATMATAGWLYSGRVQRLMSRRQHTYQIIIRQQDDAKVGAALTLLHKIRASSSPPRLTDPLDADKIEIIDFLLNRYEFIAAALWCGDIDENLLRRCDKSRMIALTTVLAGYISDKRTNNSQQSLWRNLEHISERWQRWEKREASSLCHRAYERWQMRPCRELPKAIASIDRWHEALLIKWRAANNQPTRG